MEGQWKEEDDMSDTLERLEQRLAAVEGELAVLRERLDRLVPPATLAEGGPPMLREARARQAALAATAREVFAAMGIPEEPVKMREE
jgi:hypothetical protein